MTLESHCSPLPATLKAIERNTGRPELRVHDILDTHMTTCKTSMYIFSVCGCELSRSLPRSCLDQACHGDAMRERKILTTVLQD